MTPAPTVVAFYNVWPLTHRHIHRDVVYVSQQFNARGSTLTDVELRMTGGQTTLNIVDTVTSKRIATRTFTPYGSGTTKIHFFTPIAVHNGRLYYLELLAQAAAPLAVWFGDTDEQPSLQTHCESHMAGPDVCDDAGNPHPHDLNARIFGRT